jgi:hypothetical protein
MVNGEAGADPELFPQVNERFQALSGGRRCSLCGSAAAGVTSAAGDGEPGDRRRPCQRC